MRKPTLWFQATSDINQAVQAHKTAKSLQILDLESRETVLSL